MNTMEIFRNMLYKDSPIINALSANYHILVDLKSAETTSKLMEILK